MYVRRDTPILRGNEIEVLGPGKASKSLTYDPVTKSIEPHADNRYADESHADESHADESHADDPALRGLGVAYFQTAADLLKSHRYVHR